jgi:hypothetical protein
MYESHVGKHLEHLALFVLPQISDDESEQNDGTEDYQDGNLEINPEEEQISNVGSEAGSEELPESSSVIEGDFGLDVEPFLQNAEPVPFNTDMLQDRAIRAMLAQLDQDQREKFRQLPPDKLDKLFSRWKSAGSLRPGQSSSATMSGGPEDERTRNKDTTQNDPVDDQPQLYEHDEDAHRANGHEEDLPTGTDEGQAARSITSRKCGIVDCNRRLVYDIVRNVRIYSTYCQDHTCQAPRNKNDLFCMKPRDPIDRYCPFHGKCRANSECLTRASRSEKAPFPYICPLHRCTIRGCQLPRVEPNFCERHAAHKADYDERSEMPQSVEQPGEDKKQREEYEAAAVARSKAREAEKAAKEKLEMEEPEHENTHRPKDHLRVSGVSNCAHSFRVTKSDNTLIVWHCNLCHSGPFYIIFECYHCKLHACRSCTQGA